MRLRLWDAVLRDQIDRREKPVPRRKLPLRRKHVKERPVFLRESGVGDRGSAALRVRAGVDDRPVFPMLEDVRLLRLDLDERRLEHRPEERCELLHVLAARQRLLHAARVVCILPLEARKPKPLAVDSARL